MLFITGMMRSGTTLVQKLLDIDERLDIAYQPFTSTFIEYARKFESSLDMVHYHSLTNFSPNPGYSINDFTHYLREHNFAIELESLLTNRPHSKRSLIGLKEVLTEVYVEYFLECGIKCVYVIRDPKDVLTSLSFGKGHEHVGNNRPILFDCRNWRKSALIYQYLAPHQNLHLIKFEDLIYTPEEEVRKLYQFLCLKPPNIQDLKSRLSDTWQGNSSFGKVKEAFDRSAVGGHKTKMPQDVKRYIEAVCEDEIRFFGYSEIEDSLQDSRQTIKNFAEPFLIERDEFTANYSTNKENINYEIQRLNLDLQTRINTELKNQPL